MSKRIIGNRYPHPDEALIANEAFRKAIASEEFAELLEAVARERRQVISQPVGRHTTVYRFFDSNGVLLYVGISSSALSRLEAHGDTREWWSRVASAQFEHFKDRDAALAEEKHLIQTLHPQYNVAHNRAAIPDKRIAMLERMVQRNQLPPQCYEPN